MNTIRPVFLSTYPPEECGLATFTKDSADAVDLAAGRAVSSIAAIQKIRPMANNDPRVVHTIDNTRPDSYCLVAEKINKGPYDVVSLQHEFGLYPGEWGQQILDFLRICKKPIVTTFHTLLSKPDLLPHRLIRILATQSKRVVVMTRMGEKLLAEVYGISGSKIMVVPHGVPPISNKRNPAHKQSLRLTGRKVICTFGLINRGKGLEHMIRAMPKVVATCPNALYLIVGVTHPQVKRQEGEVYRESLIELAATLGMSNHVRFINQYLSLPELLTHLQACDIFITPYPGREQIASGAMAYAMAAIGAVVSTPYLYAEEVLDEGRGLLVPFADSDAMAVAALRFLMDPVFLARTRLKAYQYAQPMFWPNVGQKYLEIFDQVADEQKKLKRKTIPSLSQEPALNRNGQLLPGVLS